MVRLDVHKSLESEAKTENFQYYSGAIRCASVENCIKDIEVFNTTVVRLDAKSKLDGLAVPARFSILQWCD